MARGPGPGITLRTVASDADLAAWRRVRMAVVPGERCDTMDELRRAASPDRLLLLAIRGETVVGSGAAGRSDVAGAGFIAPRVLAQFRRQGAGTALLGALASHVFGLGLLTARAGVDDAGSLAFATRFGFAEIDRQVEQVRPIRSESPPGDPPPGVRIALLAEQPGLWEACFDGFGREALADFALDSPLGVSQQEWQAQWAGDPMFLAVHGGEVVGCAGLHLDADQPSRAENALTAVRGDWRRRGLATYLKRLTLHWAAGHGLTEVYTWTQRGNHDMRRLNESLGYANGKTDIVLSRPLPM
jgi:mycothiol synthase